MTAAEGIDSEKRQHDLASPKLLEADVVSQCIGDFGRWQLHITFLLSLLNFPCTFHIYAPTFEAPDSDFWCAPPARFAKIGVTEWTNISHTWDKNENGELRPNPCYLKDLNYELDSVADLRRKSALTVNLLKCKKWDYDRTKFGETIVSEWDLVCEKATMKNFAEMSFLAGVAVGGLASGFISDRFGRKMTLMWSISAQIALGIAVALSPCYWIYVALRCALGFVCVSIVFCGFVLSIELVGGKWVTISGVSYLATIPLGYIAMAGIAYYIKGWRVLQLVVTLTAVIFPILSRCFVESPRWLITMRDSEKALQVMEKIAISNKRDLPADAKMLIRQAILDQGGKDDAHKVGFMDLFNTAEMRKISFVLYIVWFSVYLVYYGLVMNVQEWGGDIYLNSIISAIVELPAIGASIIILLKMGRRVPFCLVTVLAGVACLMTMFTNKSEGSLMFISLATAARFFIASSNVVMPVITAEKFPTSIRNLGVGSSNVPAGIALLLVPYLWNVAGMMKINPMAILGVCSIVGGLSVLILPGSTHL